MIEELIRRTNLDDFYSNYYLSLKSYSYKAAEKLFELSISIKDDGYGNNGNLEEWKISSINTEKVSGFDFDIMLPYIKMKILDNHPLLWLYHSDEMSCDIIGIPGDIHKLVFDLAALLEAETGGWLSFHDIFRGCMTSVQRGRFMVRITYPIAKRLEAICKEQNLTFKITERSSGNEKGYADKPNAKLLMFGNSDVSPYEYNLGQSYIIAEEFTAERIK